MLCIGDGLHRRVIAFASSLQEKYALWGINSPSIISQTGERGAPGNTGRSVPIPGNTGRLIFGLEVVMGVVYVLVLYRFQHFISPTFTEAPLSSCPDGRRF